MLELNKIYNEDCLETMKRMPDNFVDCCITSPPYWGLRDYGTGRWEGGDEGCDHRVGRFEYSVSDKQKSNSASAGHQASDTCPKCGANRVDLQVGLESTPELYVEKMTAIFREVRRVVKGTLWINLGDSYNGSGGAGSVEYHRTKHTQFGKPDRNPGRYQPPKSINTLKPKDLVGIPWRVAFALQADGWYLRSDIIWNKPNPMPESVTDRPTKAHEYIFLMSKSAKYYYDQDAILESNNTAEVTYRRLLRGRADYNLKEPYINNFPTGGRIEGRNKRSVWTIPTQPYKEAHFATYPEKLIEPCVLAGCPKDGVVYDPFMGAGTTAKVALRAQRNFIGSEINSEYCKIAEDRIHSKLNQHQLF